MTQLSARAKRRQRCRLSDGSFGDGSVRVRAAGQPDPCHHLRAAHCGRMAWRYSSTRASRRSPGLSAMLGLVPRCVNQVFVVPDLLTGRTSPRC
eukprot:91152-Hanusia_phi.AAC.2